MGLWLTLLVILAMTADHRYSFLDNMRVYITKIRQTFTKLSITNDVSLIDWSIYVCFGEKLQKKFVFLRQM